MYIMVYALNIIWNCENEYKQYLIIGKWLNILKYVFQPFKMFYETFLKSWETSYKCVQLK